MATFYVGSDGKSHDITTMVYQHLLSARRKLQRKPTPFGSDASASQRMGEISRDQALIKAMLAEEATRNLAYAANVHLKPDAELLRALGDMTPARRAEPDWTPERQRVFDAVTAEVERRRNG